MLLCCAAPPLASSWQKSPDWCSAQHGALHGRNGNGSHNAEAIKVPPEEGCGDHAGRGIPSFKRCGSGTHRQQRRPCCPSSQPARSCDGTCDVAIVCGALGWRGARAAHRLRCLHPWRALSPLVVPGVGSLCSRGGRITGWGGASWLGSLSGQRGVALSECTGPSGGQPSDAAGKHAGLRMTACPGLAHCSQSTASGACWPRWWPRRTRRSEACSR